jgi:hypothetical protein
MKLNVNYDFLQVLRTGNVRDELLPAFIYTRTKRGSTATPVNRAVQLHAAIQNLIPAQDFI